MKTNKIYSKPQIKVIKLDETDIIATSNEGTGGMGTDIPAEE